MSTLTTCPYCGQPIGSAELRHIHDAEAAKLKEVRQSVQADLAKELERAKAVQHEAEERARQLEADFAKRLRESVLATTEDLTRQMDEVARQKAEAEQRANGLMAELESRVKDAEDRARMEAEAGLYKAIHEKDKKLEVAQKTIEDLQKRLEAKPAHELGAVQEDDLVRILQAEFPRDRIRRIAQVSGADIEQEVFKEGESCGLIIYESKNAATWSSGWIPKLKSDALMHGASACILVTQAFPGKTQDFTSIDSVPVIHPRFLLSLVRVVREGLIAVREQALSQQNRGYKLEQLMGYLNGPDFRNRMNSVCDSVRKLEEIQQKERKSHDKTWNDQAVLYRTVTSSSSEIDNEIRAILLGR